MKICNIKMSVYFENDLFTKKRSNEKVIFHEKSWIMTIYYHTPNHVNVTSVKCREDIQKVIIYLEWKYGVKSVRHQIDCAMISHKDNIKIKMSEIANVLKTISTLYHVELEPEIFTGMFLKPYNREYPTINLFYTGSYQLLGGKSFEKIDESISIIKSLIKQCVINNYDSST